MKCPFCSEPKNDNPNLDNIAEHLIMVISPQGVTHIHGPWTNEFGIRKMFSAFVAEAEKNGIQLRMVTEERPGD